ncbi:MAG: universal stress protein [Candidatus Sulfotelmatobacter sp.]
MKVLLAIDSSRASQDVVKAAIARPWPSGTTFCALNVVDLRHWKGLPQLIKDARQSGQMLVDAAADKLTRAGHKTLGATILGVPGKAIAKYAEQWRANLIMLGSRELNVATRFVLGSVSQSLLRSAPCSVEIVRRDSLNLPTSAHAAMKVLVATDGSPCSVSAVTSIAMRTWPAKTEFKIASVVELLIPENESAACTLASVYPPQLLERLLNDAGDRAKNALAEGRTILERAGLSVSESMPAPFGDPRSVILDEARAWGADLIVVGSHGRHGIDRVLMGSVSESVALHAHCSVEVVRFSGTRRRSKLCGRRLRGSDSLVQPETSSEKWDGPRRQIRNLGRRQNE